MIPSIYSFSREVEDFTKKKKRVVVFSLQKPGSSKSATTMLVAGQRMIFVNIFGMRSINEMRERSITETHGKTRMFITLLGIT